MQEKKLNQKQAIDKEIEKHKTRSPRKASLEEIPKSKNTENPKPNQQRNALPSAVPTQTGQPANVAVAVGLACI